MLKSFRVVAVVAHKILETPQVLGPWTLDSGLSIEYNSQYHSFTVQ